MSITIDDIIYGINKQSISGFGNYHVANITGANVPLPDLRFDRSVLVDSHDLGNPLDQAYYPVKLQDYLDGIYLQKCPTMNGFRTDKNYLGRATQSKGDYITQNFNKNYAGAATELGAGAFTGGFIDEALEEAPEIEPVGKPDGQIENQYTVVEPNPFPVRTRAVLR